MIIWLLSQSSENNNIEEMKVWTHSTSSNDNQFILKNSDGPRTFVQKNKDNRVKLTNIPFPNETDRSNICNNQVCASCDCYNPILMNMCKECPKSIDACNCDDC